MPVHKVKGGYQWGETGKVYKGRDAKKKAIKQAIAIAYSEAERRGKEKPSQEDITKTIKGEEITKEANMNYPIRNTMAYLQKRAADSAGDTSARYKAEQRSNDIAGIVAGLPASRVGSIVGGAALGGAAGAGGAYLIAKYLLKKKLSTAAMVGAGLAGAGLGGVGGYFGHKAFGAPATMKEYEAIADKEGRYTGEDGDKLRASDLDYIRDRGKGWSKLENLFGRQVAMNILGPKRYDEVVVTE